MAASASFAPGICSYTDTRACYMYTHTYMDHNRDTQRHMHVTCIHIHTQRHTDTYTHRHTDTHTDTCMLHVYTYACIKIGRGGRIFRCTNSVHELGSSCTDGPRHTKRREMCNTYACIKNRHTHTHTHTHLDVYDGVCVWVYAIYTRIRTYV